MMCKKSFPVDDDFIQKVLDGIYDDVCPDEEDSDLDFDDDLGGFDDDSDDDF